MKEFKLISAKDDTYFVKLIEMYVEEGWEIKAFAFSDSKNKGLMIRELEEDLS